MPTTPISAELTPVTPRADANDALFERIAADYAAPLSRLAHAHEADPSLQQDLLQDIHIALWRSLPAFAGRCSLRTWVYRVAHNVAATHVLRQQRRGSNKLVNLDDIDIASDAPAVDSTIDAAQTLARVHALLQRLKPLDREVFVLYLEGVPVEEMAEIAGLSQSNTHTKLHRIRMLLTSQLGGENP